MGAARLALLTDRRWVAAGSPDWFMQNILDEDALLSAALARRGWSTQRIAWDDLEVDWSAYPAAVFRTTWDYVDRLAEFTSWLDQAEAAVRLINPLSLVRWNMDKHYLLDLARRGVPVVSSLFAEAGSDESLAEFVARSGWKEMVLKPAVSGSGRHTHRVSADRIESRSALFAQLLSDEAMLLQPLQQAVFSEGELSLMVFGGRFTHAVRKIGKTGDFRVQDDFGGSVVDHQPSREQLDLAQRAVAACSPAPAYARVDMILGNDGRYQVMELELIEPELWLRKHPPAAEAFAEALIAAIK